MAMNEPPGTDAAPVRARHERRDADTDRYSPLRPEVWLTEQEKERALLRWIHSCCIAPVKQRSLLEIGCGSGTNLLLLLRLGFEPENMLANELRKEAAAVARRRLPASLRVVVGDAAELQDDIGPFDIVMQSTVFTSLLDDAFQQRLAARMWALARPGGGVLWYDFVYNNPRNRDVRGVPVGRIRQLFPEARLRVWPVTLAPPIARRVVRVHPALYGLFNLTPLLRSHVLCWAQKPG